MLADDVGLEADDGVEHVESASVVVDVFFVALDAEFDDAFDFVDEVQDDGVVLVVGGLEVVRQPHL